MKLSLFLSIMCLPLLGLAQKISCQEAYEIVLEYGENKRTITPYGSSMLTKVVKYEVDGTLYVVGYIKKNDYDFKGSPYLFCGVSRYDWNSFTYNYINSAGEAFHKYIFPYKCD